MIHIIQQSFTDIMPKTFFKLEDGIPPNKIHIWLQGDIYDRLHGIAFIFGVPLENMVRAYFKGMEE